MGKQFRFSFQIWGLVLFFVIMVPNFYSFAVPAPVDLFAAPSVTGTLDAAASLCQVLMIAVLCLVKNTRCGPVKLSPWIYGSLGFCLVYYGGWFFYYQGVTNAAVILTLCLAPCLAFGSFAIDRKNWPAMAPLSVFTVCHLIYGICNFIL